ncbi:LAP1 [Coprinopsis cinerea okayama7|uniref:Peptide hydrolase n=1 Tax=Coprinopsis cinerea (strain Okayama-7 / 130 / ATCC MYA-4618 / FGSC 9003) TaxID=240176 RepID=A8NAH4_COPC7|nr:LAP1 [Coprinopsis cinerea okayama7\|eukprot:XP_001831826.1 LAP1 [Coprinopsis cinerea okayama7\
MKPSLYLLGLSLSLRSFVLGTSDADEADIAGIGPRRPLVDSEKLQASIHANNLLHHARQFEKFSDLSNRNRAFGSKGHNATVNYIKRLLDQTGYYDTYLQTFPYQYSESRVSFSANDVSYETTTFTYGPTGNVEAPLVPVDALGCTAADFPDRVAGNIALILRGECEFGLKVALAGAAGATGAIIYNNADGNVGSATLSLPSRPDVGPYVPVAGLSGIQGNALKAAIERGEEVVGNLRATGLTEIRYSSNVIATSKIGDKENIVFAGAHTDSVPAGPGINDDGSGTIAVLEIALHLTKYRVKNAVRFGFWTTEEFGLVGSEYHVTNLSDEERQKIALYLNFDMLASPNAAYFVHDGDGSDYGLVGPAGSDKIEKLYQDWFEARGLKTAPAAFSGSSDYDPFLQVGIPVGGVLTGASGLKTEEGVEQWGGEAEVAYDKCYHLLCDTVENLNVPFWVNNAKAAAHSIATYARSLEGIPRDQRVSVAGSLPITKLSWDERKHFACNHPVSQK